MNSIWRWTLCIIALSATHALEAQSRPDSALPKQLTDSAYLHPSTQKTIAKTQRGFHSYIIPVTMIAYGLLSMHTDPLLDVNESFKEKIYSERHPAKTSADNYLQYAPGAAVYLLNATGIRGKNNIRDASIIYAMSNLMVGTTIFVVKHITAETRPDNSNNLSFPSGHTATAFAAAEFLYQEYKHLSPLYGVAGYMAAAATGYLRMQNNKHWLGDVVAGAGVGIVCTKLSYALYPAIKRTIFKGKEVKTVLLPSYQNGSWVIGLIKQF